MHISKRKILKILYCPQFYDALEWWKEFAANLTPGEKIIYLFCLATESSEEKRSHLLSFCLSFFLSFFLSWLVLFCLPTPAIFCLQKVGGVFFVSCSPVRCSIVAPSNELCLLLALAEEASCPVCCCCCCCLPDSKLSLLLSSIEKKNERAGVVYP